MIKFFFFLVILISSSLMAEDGLDQELEDTFIEFSQMGGLELNEDGSSKDLELSDQDEDPIEPVEVKDSYLTRSLNPAMKNQLSIMMARSPFYGMDKEVLQGIVSARLRTNPLGSVLANSPRLENVFLDFLLDEKAMPSMLKIVNKPDEVKTLGIFALIVFVVSFILNTLNSKGSFFKKLIKRLLIILGAFVLNFSFFIFQFYENLKPTLSIFFKYFHL